ncbi:Cys-Gln thioester bond-forming surface protein [Micromonospora sp. STR1_7]|uniref:Cys-Gln thioester bond-forming surface protein n=1 Tax=Micromonospora parastrephiae TaxID=2806101 RepID=A0ABS1XYV1_9ACTN|nr:thioester domain-containing protein [Micromonospora parastrephiae]MBM0234422.1 Cys-Gln thioester bond-forming surface protein [Micromonospora parastrephiae]
MFGQRGRRWARVALAAVAGGALAFGVAGAAAAAPATGVAKVVDGTEVTLKLDGKQRTTSALALKIDGKLVPTFCIDYHTGVKLDGKYQEGTWDASQVKNLGKVQWVLTHGYPNADSKALLAAAGVSTKIGQKRLDTLLYFGTQTAVWHFSDGIELGNWEKGLLARDQYEVITKVRDYLVKNATDQPEPRAELSVDPANATATVGAKAGPFTVKGPAGAITVAATGGTAVDAEGKPVTTTTNGGQFWLTAEGAGAVNVTLTAQDSVSFGRVFLFTGTKKAQKLILGGSTGATVTAKAAASFTAGASPTPTAVATPTASPSPTTPEPPRRTPRRRPARRRPPRRRAVAAPCR